MDIAIHTDMIQLDQFLKLAEGMILRNDVPETARRRKLVPGDVITIDGSNTYRVVRV